VNTQLYAPAGLLGSGEPAPRPSISCRSTGSGQFSFSGHLPARDSRRFESVGPHDDLPARRHISSPSARLGRFDRGIGPRLRFWPACRCRSCVPRLLEVAHVRPRIWRHGRVRSITSPDRPSWFVIQHGRGWSFCSYRVETVWFFCFFFAGRRFKAIVLPANMLRPGNSRPFTRCYPLPQPAIDQTAPIA